MWVRLAAVVVSEFVLIALDEEVRKDWSLLQKWILLRLRLILSVTRNDRVIRDVELRSRISLLLLHTRVVLLTHHLVRWRRVLGHLCHLMLLKVVPHLCCTTRELVLSFGRLMNCSHLDFIV